MRDIQTIKADIANTQQIIDMRGDYGSDTTTAIYQMAELQRELKLALIDGIDTDRLETICQAEKDGRLVVLPCKVGDTVYELTECFDSENRCKGNCDECPKRRQTIKVIVRTKAHAVRIAERGLIGKTVFLTESEALQAMQEERK